MIKAAILTVSDRCANEQQEDHSAPAVEEILSRNGFDVGARSLVPDEQDVIARELVSFCDGGACDVVFTTGGTGLGPRDVTPEATSSVCERLVPGLVELMRAESLKKTRNAVLSRAVAGLRGNTLIINLPGSPKAVRECVEILLDILPHAVEMIHGGGH
ncbi:MAG: MogA/MoaB family molybdenum cofactor biosynthesis protein [Sedimentisphaerales bacterium]|nr:MogA/MoaB family molybdenum cofactor biosynthesis protein [Sedimentisphaerales bacterium]